MFECQVDDSSLVPPRDRLDDLVMVLAGLCQACFHLIVGGPEEGVADAGVIDQQPPEARAQIHIPRHLAHDLVEAVVLQHHRRRVGGQAGLRLVQVRDKENWERSRLIYVVTSMARQYGARVLVHGGPAADGRDAEQEVKGRGIISNPSQHDDAPQIRKKPASELKAPVEILP